MMSQSQYSLSWESHLRNVCDGLSTLQQNGEFVDMTLAADGHMVKVHQVVLALASPYFKELIASAKCPHPVIFLSRITHATLSAMLEYIYTGEVLVSLEHLHELVEAAKELHIKGLKDMKVHPFLSEISKQISTGPEDGDMLENGDQSIFQMTDIDSENVRDPKDQGDDIMDNVTHFIVDNEQLRQVQGTRLKCTHDSQEKELAPSELADQVESDNNINQDSIMQEEDFQNIADEDMQDTNSNLTFETANSKIDTISSALQYTVSNQGSLQMILNRFVYYLKHTNRDKSRQWRCVDYLSHSAKCPAHVFTKDDIVVHRIAAHTHPFHDKKILKKLKNGVVFSAFTEAEKEGDMKKKKSITITSDTE